MLAQCVSHVIWPLCALLARLCFDRIHGAQHLDARANRSQV